MHRGRYTQAEEYHIRVLRLRSFGLLAAPWAACSFITAHGAEESLLRSLSLSLRVCLSDEDEDDDHSLISYYPPLLPPPALWKKSSGISHV